MVTQQVRRVSQFAAVGVFLALLPVPTAGAAIIYDNGPSDQFDSTVMSFDAVIADDFTFTGNSTFNSVRFWDFESLSNAPYTGGFHWYIFGDNLGHPGSILFQGDTTDNIHTATGYDDGSYAEYVNNFTFNPINFGAGTYWLGLHTAPVEDIVFPPVFWADAADNGTAGENSAHLPALNDWFATSHQATFQLIDTNAAVATPEPSTWAMMAMGLASLVALTHRRKQSRS